MQAVAHKQYYVYIMLSQTQTGFARTIRKITGNTYSHSSIAFDADLKHMYGFARYRSRVPVVAGLVREYPERFTLNKVKNVPVRIYRIPVTKTQYMIGARSIRHVMRDRESYMYNLYSVLTYPLFRGIRTYKAFTCSEFIVFLLTIMGVPMRLSKHAYQYTPEQLIDVLRDYDVVFEGNLLDYADASEHRPAFFRSPNYVRDGISSAYYLARLAYRGRGNFNPARFKPVKAAFYRKKGFDSKNEMHN